MVSLEGGTAKAIIGILSAASEPLTRKDIAIKLGRSSGRLNPYDMVILETLVEEGRAQKVEVKPIAAQPLRIVPAYQLIDVPTAK
jgi:hypothetical protein